jgi:hypothetical protein
MNPAENYNLFDKKIEHYDSPDELINATIVKLDQLVQSFNAEFAADSQENETKPEGIMRNVTYSLKKVFVNLVSSSPVFSREYAAEKQQQYVAWLEAIKNVFAQRLSEFNEEQRDQTDIRRFYARYAETTDYIRRFMKEHSGRTKMQGTLRSFML